MHNINSDLVNLIKSINSLVKENSLDIQLNSTYPTIFIIGSPRTGSTLFTQWLASQQTMAYPTNFISRFYSNPLIGAQIQEMIFNDKYNYANEFKDVRPNYDFKSNYGKTEGILAPHEFWFFWKRFFDFKINVSGIEEFKNNFKYNQFNYEINRVKEFYQKPFFMKAKIINYYLEPFIQKTQNSFFIFLRRDKLETAQSILIARKNWTGDKENWFSWKPRNYDYLKKLTPIEQCIAQHYQVEKEIIQALSKNKTDYLEIWYEDFCNSPKLIYDKIHEKIRLHLKEDYSYPVYNGIESFSVSKKLSIKEKNDINSTYQKLENILI